MPGTTLITDSLIDNENSRLSLAPHLTAVGTTLFFVADDGSHYEGLWKSDGTTNGTVLLKSFNVIDPFFGRPLQPHGGGSHAVLRRRWCALEE